MPTTTALSAGGSISISLAAGSSLSAYGMGTMQIAPPVPVYLDAALRPLSPNEQRIGPFAAAVTVNLTAVAGGSGVSYYTIAPTDVVLPGANAPSGATLTAAQTAATQAMVSGAGLLGVQRNFFSMPLPPADSTGGAAKTFDVQIPAKRSFKGVRFVFLNLNTAAANYTAMRCAAAPKHLINTGAELTWSGLLTVNGSSAFAVPAGVAGGKANYFTPGVAITDFYPLQPVARTDTVTGKYLVRVRSRSAVEVQKVYSVGSAFPPAWNAYVGADGPRIGSYQATADQVTSTPVDSTSVLESGGYIQPVIALFAYDTPATQVWAFGDSLFEGNGSSVGPAAGTGILGWPTLINLQQASIDALNMGVTGQTTEDSIAMMYAMLKATDDLPRFVALKAYSPNDGNPTQALIDAVWGRLLAACSWLRSKGITPVLFTSPPVNSWSAGQRTFNEAQNARAAALVVACPWIRLVDMWAAVRDPANTRQILPAYNYGDGTHYLDAGHQAVADAAVAVLSR